MITCKSKLVIKLSFISDLLNKAKNKTAPNFRKKSELFVSPKNYYVIKR